MRFVVVIVHIIDGLLCEELSPNPKLRLGGDGFFQQAVVVVVGIGALDAVGVLGADQPPRQVVVVAGDGVAIVVFFDEATGFVTDVTVGVAFGVGDFV